MLPLSRSKVRTQLPIDPCQQVQVERRRHALGVVVRGLQNCGAFFRSTPISSPPPGPATSAMPPQKPDRLLWVEVADGRAGEIYHGACRRACAGWQRELLGVVRADRQHFQVRVREERSPADFIRCSREMSIGT